MNSISLPKLGEVGDIFSSIDLKNPEPQGFAQPLGIWPKITFLKGRTRFGRDRGIQADGVAFEHPGNRNTAQPNRLLESPPFLRA